MNYRSEPTAEDVAGPARALIASYAWQSVAERDIVEQALQRLAETPHTAPPPNLPQLLEQAASATLYLACAPPGVTADPAAANRIRQGYTDLGNYLMRVAAQLPPPGAGWERADLVQAALVEVYRQYAGCRQPGAFLAWASQILRKQARQHWRRAGRESPLLDDPSGAFSPARPARTATHDANPEGDQSVLYILRKCLTTDEERTLALLFMFGLKRRELGIVFERPLTYFDELSRKVKRKLRTCSDFQALRRPPAPDAERSTRDSASGPPREEPVNLAEAVEAAQRALLIAWVMGDPAPEVVASPEYARYRVLLPEVLSGIVGPGGAEYDWFAAYLDECDACRDEYEELRAARDAERARWSAPGGPASAAASFPAPDLSFLGGAPRQEVAAIWALALIAEAAIRQAPGGPRVEVQVRRPPTPSAPPARQVAEEPAPAPWKPLLRQTFGLAEGLAAPYTLSVVAERLDETTCRLHVTLASPTQGPAIGVAVQVTPATGAAIALVTDAQGQATVVLPIAALPGLTLRVALPPAPPTP